MHPAYSVIFFTVASGAGYGLLIVFALTAAVGHWSPTNEYWLSGIVAMSLATGLVISGLLSSTLHLGHPERAWRALSQWKTSWLSREGVAAIVTFIPILLLAWNWWQHNVSSTALQTSAVLVVIGSIITVACTAMIYASLKPIPRWHHPWVLPVYLTFSLSAGLLLAATILTFSGRAFVPLIVSTAAMIVLAWACKLIYWRSIDTASPTSSAESATGLGNFGSVNVLESPHTSANYIQKEMGFSIARKHSTKLRRIAVLMGLIAPLLLCLAAIWLDYFLQVLCLGVAVLSTFSAHLLERWLFFAEAQHVATLFYGNAKV